MFDPLDGLKVLDFSRVVAGPFATRMMSDLGADVVKIEPPDGDLTRLWGHKVAGISGFFTQQNAGKRDVCIDLKADGASELLLRMGAEADVVVENYRPGVMERLGLNYDAFRNVKPSIVMLSVSGFGQTGEWRSRAAFAPILHAESGLIGRQATFDEARPVDPMLSIADTNAALHGLIAVLAALRLRDREGVGQHIDMAMLNSMTVTDDYAHNALDGVPTTRLGGFVWETGYGNILVSGNEQSQWYLLSRAGVLRDGLPGDATVEEKIATRHRIIRDWYRSFDDRAELVAALDAVNIAWADVRSPDEVFETVAARERNLSVDVDDRAGGTRRVVQSPYHFSDARSEVRGGAPFRGEHNDEALTDWLGLTSSEIAALRADGVLLSEEAARSEASVAP